MSHSHIQVRDINQWENFFQQRTKDKEEDCEAYRFDRVYLIGFLTGVNSLAPKDIMASTDAEGLTGWIDNYCKEHPLDAIDEAANALALELNQ